MTKTPEDYFYDWYNNAFGYGYGTGDEYYCNTLVAFFHALTSRGDHSPYGYSYKEMERLLGPDAFWFMLNTLCDKDIVEYGTSPRYGWLTPQGERLRQFLEGHTSDTLYDLWASYDEGYAPCYPDICNHTDNEKRCPNLFWTSKWEGQAW